MRMRTVKSLIVLIMLAWSMSCGQTDRLIGFDTTTWEHDEYGCEHKRAALATELMTRKDELLGLNTKEVTSLLGKPDRIELYKRSQRFLVYFIEPGEQCSNYEAKELVRNITIRFDALGRAKEIVLYK